jgi:gluconolactonase
MNLNRPVLHGVLALFVAACHGSTRGGGSSADAVSDATVIADSGSPGDPSQTGDGAGNDGPVAADTAVADTAGPDARVADGGPAADGAPARAVCPAGPFPAPMVLSDQTVCANFTFVHNYNEGPTWVAAQSAFFFTNFIQGVGIGGDIIKYTPNGACEVFIQGVGCNGLAVTPDGNIVAACHQTRSVVRFDLTTRQPTTVASGYQGQLLNTPNDLVVHSNGTIYFTNPPYELDGRTPGAAISIFRIDPTGMPSVVAQVPIANGIALSPDESRLYALQGGIWDLDPQGVPSNQRALFASGDGMAVDCAGNIYASGIIYSPAGQRVGSYPTDGTNLAFGGADGKTLLIVGGGTRVRALQLNVPGLP